MHFHRNIGVFIFLMATVLSSFSFAQKSSMNLSAKEIAVAVKSDFTRMKSNASDPNFDKEIAKIYLNYAANNYSARKQLESIVEMYSFLFKFKKQESEQENELRLKINRFVKMMIQTDPKSFADILLEHIRAKLAKEVQTPMDLSFLLLHYSNDLQEAVLLHMDRELQKPEFKLYATHSNNIRNSLRTKSPNN